MTGVHVAATLTAPLEPFRQAMLFDAAPAHGVRGAQFAALVERLSSRLGRRSVAGVRLRPEAQPELSWHYDPLVEQRRRCCGPKALPHELPPRPLRLLPRPRPLLAMSVVPDGPPLKFHDAGREQQIAKAGDRSGSKPAGGAAGRWAATISASRRPPAAASGSSADYAMENGSCTECLIE